MWSDRLKNYALSVIISVFLFDVIIQENRAICALGEIAANGITKLKTTATLNCRSGSNGSRLKGNKREPVSASSVRRKTTNLRSDQSQREMESESGVSESSKDNNEDGPRSTRQNESRLGNTFSNPFSDFLKFSKGTSHLVDEDAFMRAKQTANRLSLQHRSNHRGKFQDAEIYNKNVVREDTSEVDDVNADGNPAEPRENSSKLGERDSTRTATSDPNPISYNLNPNTEFGGAKEPLEEKKFSEGHDTLESDEREMNKEQALQHHAPDEDINTHDVEDESTVSIEESSYNGEFSSLRRTPLASAREQAASDRDDATSQQRDEELVTRDERSVSRSRASIFFHTENESQTDDSPAVIIEDARLVVTQNIEAKPSVSESTPALTTNNVSEEAGITITSSYAIDTTISDSLVEDTSIASNESLAKGVGPKLAEEITEEENVQTHTVISNSAEDFAAAAAAVSASIAVMIQI